MHQENNIIAIASTRWVTQPLPASQWTRDEDKLFERALLRVPEDAPDRWEQVAGKVPGKSPIDVKEHFDRLIHDVSLIDSGRVALPNFEDHPAAAAGGGAAWDSDNQISFGGKTKHGEPERKKGTPWTEHEHKLFLIGLDRFGRGDWRSISRNVVVSRTPTQVASHAQKYFLRQSSGKKERKRSSIHDITTVEAKVVPSPPADPNWVPPPQTQSVPMQQLQQPQEMQPQFNIPPNNVLDQRGVGRFGYSHYGY